MDTEKNIAKKLWCNSWTWLQWLAHIDKVWMIFYILISMVHWLVTLSFMRRSVGLFYIMHCGVCYHVFKPTNKKVNFHSIFFVSLSAVRRRCLLFDLLHVIKVNLALCRQRVNWKSRIVFVHFGDSELSIQYSKLCCARNTVIAFLCSVQTFKCHAIFSSASSLHFDYIKMRACACVHT